MRRLTPVLLAALMAGARALAETADVPALFSAGRIPWAVRCAGAMPPLLAGALAAIFALAIACVILYGKTGDRDEP